MRTTLTKNTKLQNFLQKILTESFSKLQKDHPKYSLRTFARKLGISPASLSEMMNGKRMITAKTISKMQLHLELSEDEKTKLSKFEQSSSSFKIEQKKYVQIDVAENPVLVEWHFFAIMALSVTSDFKSDPQWIGQRLDLPVSVVKRAVDELIRVQIFSRLPDGSLESNGVHFNINSSVQKQLFKKGHTQHLAQAQKAVLNEPSENLDFSSMTMAIDPELLPDANEMIRDFRRRLAQFLGSGKNEEVFKLNIQLFPLSKR